MKQFFHLCNTGFSRCNSFLLFINCVIFILLQLRDKFCHYVVIIRRFLSRSGNDQWCTCFINQNGVDFIDQAEMQRTLYHLIQ